MADGMWQVGNQNQVLKAKGWEPQDKCLPAADSCQHHLHNLSCGPRKPFQPRKRILFRRHNAGILLKTKDGRKKLLGLAGMYMKTKEILA